MYFPGAQSIHLGSGTSLLLELFTALQPYTSSVKHKIRFAFWGAEESSMAGSQSYLSTLTPTSLSQILLYLNFDMVGRGYFGVFDGDGSSFGAESAGATGSEVAEKLFVDELVRKGVEVTPVKLTGGSDYKWFMEAGIPVGGLHSGTGKEQDSCYHLACDTYNNVNSTVLSINAKVRYPLPQCRHVTKRIC
jgi:Zn-dependent M28 family amino/carboxypeptidase